MTLPVGPCPPIILSNPICGVAEWHTTGSSEFTTYDQRSCQYQKQKRVGISDCVDDGGPTTVNLSCTAEAGTSCPGGPN